MQKKPQKTKKKQYKWQTSIQLYDIFKFDEIKWRRECFTVAPVNNSCQNRNIVQNLNEILHNVKVVSALTIYTLKFIVSKTSLQNNSFKLLSDLRNASFGPQLQLVYWTGL